MSKEEKAAAASRQHAAHLNGELEEQFIRETSRSLICMRAFEGIDTKAVEALAAKGGVLDLARKAEKVAIQLAAALSANALLRETSGRTNIIPAGWALNSADFSIIATGGSKPGMVALVRTGEDRANWHRFADADKVDLYAYGNGATFDEALADAIETALAAGPVPQGGAL